MSDYVRAHGEPAHVYHREAVEIAGKFEVDATVVDGVVRWRSNGHVPPDDILLLWQHLGKPFDCAKSRRVSGEETRAFVEQYRKSWKPPSGEQIAEMRAEGLSGVMVDVVAGRTFRV